MSSPPVKRVHRDTGAIFLWDLKDLWTLLASFLDTASVKSLRLVSKELSYAPFVSNFMWDLNRIHHHPALIPSIRIGKCVTGRTLDQLAYYSFLDKLILTGQDPYDEVDVCDLGKALMALPALRGLECTDLNLPESLGHLTQLVSLNCSFCSFADNDIVAKLSGLTALTLLQPPFGQSLPQFPQLTSLECLCLDKVCRSEVALSHFRLLTKLCLLNSDIDSSALRGMSQLLFLEARGCKNLDGLCLLEMPSLTGLDFDSLEHCEDALHRLTQLRSLKCRNLDFRSALCLTRMQSLTSLTCIMDSCDDFSLDVLPRLTRLSELTLFCVEPSVFDSMAFANLFLLRTLYLCESRLLVGEALASVTPSLTFLDYSHQFVSGFSFSHLTALTTLMCSRCDMLTDSAFEGLVSLTSLKCCDCLGLRSPFRCLTSLTALDCSACKNLSTTALIDLVNLRTLNCSDCTSLQNSSSFASLTAITSLKCDNCFSLKNMCFVQLTSLTRLSCTNMRLRAGCFDSLLHLTELNCSGCNRLSTGSFDRLTRLSVLECVGCISLTDDCIRTLNQLDTLNVQGCSGLTRGFFTHLTNLTSLTGSLEHCPGNDRLRHMTRLAKLSWV